MNQTLVHTNSGNLIQRPKTTGSQRVVIVFEETIEALKERKKAGQKEREDYEVLYGPGSYADPDLAFPNHEGKPTDPRSFTRQFERLVEKAGVPRIRFHDLRHTHATLMLKAGVHVKVTAERLGHSQISTTMDTYGHVLPTMQQEVAASVDRILGLKKDQ